MIKFFNHLVVVFLMMFFLSGCWSSMKGKETDSEVDLTFRDNQNCIFWISPDVGLETADSSDLKSDQKTDTPIDFDLNLDDLKDQLIAQGLPTDEIEKILSRFRQSQQPAADATSQPVEAKGKTENSQQPEPATGQLTTYYHHTSQGKKEAGNLFSNKTTLVQCPSDPAYDKCLSGSYQLTLHNQKDTGRYVFYLASGQLPAGAVISCQRGDQLYQIKVGDGITMGQCNSKPPDIPVVIGPEETKTLVATYFGPTNGKRSTWYFQPGTQLPKQFYLSIAGCLENKQITLDENGRIAGVPQGSPGWVVKPTEVEGRGPGILAPDNSCTSPAYVNWI